MESGWYYVINDTRIGPVEHSEIERLVSQGSLEAHTLVWREGLDGWEEAAHHFKFSGGVSGPPPIPPRERGVGASVAIAASANTGRDHERTTRADGLYPGAPARGFGEAISTCFRKYVTFSGRASRSEFWYFTLFGFLIGIVARIIDTAISNHNNLQIINSLVFLTLLLPGISVSVRRLHDINRSGWWYGGFYLVLIGGTVVLVFMATSAPNASESLSLFFISLFGITWLVYSIVLLVFFCLRGNAGPNRFG